MSFLLAALTFLFPGPPAGALAGGLFWGGWFSSPTCSAHALLASFLFEVPVALLSCSGWVPFPPARFQAFPLCSPRADWPGPSHLKLVASGSISTEKQEKGDKRKTLDFENKVKQWTGIKKRREGWERKGRKGYDEIADVSLHFNRRCVYFTELKLNICHVTWWSEARIPTKSERGGKRNVCS